MLNRQPIGRRASVSAISWMLASGIFSSWVTEETNSDLIAASAMPARTDRSAKETVSKDGVARRVPELLEAIHSTLFEQALAFRRSRTYRVSDYDEFKALMADRERLGFVEGWWCGDRACEAAIKAETQATITVANTNDDGRVRCAKRLRLRRRAKTSLCRRARTP